MSDKYLEYTSDGRIAEKPSAETSSGAADAGRIVGLGPDGKLDNSLYSLDALYGYSVGPVTVAPTSSATVDSLLLGVFGTVEWLVRLVRQDGAVRSFKLLCSFDGSVSPPFSVYSGTGIRMDYAVDVTYNTSSGVAELVVSNNDLTRAITVTVMRLATR